MFPQLGHGRQWYEAFRTDHLGIWQGTLRAEMAVPPSVPRRGQHLHLVFIVHWYIPQKNVGAMQRLSSLSVSHLSVVAKCHQLEQRVREVMLVQKFLMCLQLQVRRFPKDSTQLFEACCVNQGNGLCSVPHSK